VGTLELLKIVVTEDDPGYSSMAQKLNAEVFSGKVQVLPEHQPCSPALASCNFFMFPEVKISLYRFVNVLKTFRVTLTAALKVISESGHFNLMLCTAHLLLLGKSH
jgi:hypothetical protein